MKTKRNVDLDLDNVIPLIITIWRRWQKLPGPDHELQTREFRGIVDTLIKTTEEGEPSKGFDDHAWTSAYLMYHWVIRYSQAMSVLGELPEPPKRVLDLCSGPAPMAFAALKHGASDVYAVDSNLLALKLGGEICGRYGYTLTCRQTDCRKSHQVDGKFDAIFLGYSLEALFPSNKQGWLDQWTNYVKSLTSQLNDGGHLILIDSSLNEMNEKYLRLRDRLAEEHIPILAPCVWKGQCPALEAKSPCYAQRDFVKPYLIKELQRGASINLNSLKMTYFILGTSKSKGSIASDRAMYRIISPPVDSYRGKRYHLCGTDGKKILESTFKEDHPKDSRAFEYLKRGELISFENIRKQGSALTIIEGTKITVEAPNGKPPPMVYTQDNS